MAAAVAVWAFWACLTLALYVFAGFPALVWVIGRIRKREVRKGQVTPPLSVVIAAFNEEHHIADRIRNVLACDYPADALEVIVASDGSTDATEAVARGFADSRVTVLGLERRGKIHALDEAVTVSRGDILVFTDANAVFDAAALRTIAENFADPEVGGVAGRTIYRHEHRGESSGIGESLYLRYDTWLKALESRTGSVVSAHGALYAVRRAFYRRPPDASVTDDFWISTGVVHLGARLVFEPRAVAYERPADKASGEFRRRVRLTTRGLRALASRRSLLDPRRSGFYSLVLASHKVLRRAMPAAVPVFLGASLIAAPAGPLYAAAAVLQFAFFALAAVGWATRHRPAGRRPWFSIPFYLCLANAAGFVAIIRFLRGDRIELWRPQRSGPDATAGVTLATDVGGVGNG